MDFDFETMTDEEIIDLIHDLSEGTEELEKNPDKAAAAAKAGADKGNAEAQYLYGTFLIQGVGAEKDEEAAGEYWRKSAEQGCAPALNRLGMCCMAGACGFEKNSAKAAEYFSAAAQKGYAESYVHLYGLYNSETGAEQNHAKALECLKAAVEADYSPAYLLLGIEILQNSASSPERQAEGAALLRKAAEDGDMMAQLFYGTCCENGIGIEKDLSEAAGWYRRAAKAGSVPANNALKKLGFPGVM